MQNLFPAQWRSPRPHSCIKISLPDQMITLGVMLRLEGYYYFLSIVDDHSVYLGVLIACQI